MAKKIKNVQYFEAVGRRKEAVAQVRLYLPGKEKKVIVGGKEIKTGEIVVNGKPINAFFTSEVDRQRYLSPLRIAKSEDRFAVSIKVAGGGKSGQLEAVIMGIARALVIVDTGVNKSILKKQGFLRRDARTRQRRKVGMGGKSRRKKQSPKR